MFDTVTFKADTVLYHATNMKTDSHMRSLVFDVEDSERCTSDGEASLRTRSILEHYTALKDGEFPTDLRHPKWFSLPPHYYCGDIYLNYTLKRDIVLADLREVSDRAPSIHPTKAHCRSQLDDTMQYIARCMFSPKSWPYYYYNACEYETEWAPSTYGPFPTLPIDGWVAYFDSDEMAEIALFKPYEVVSVNYKIVEDGKQ